MMKFLQFVGLLIIALFAGCITNNGDSRPEFIEELYQKEQLPDSVGLVAQIEIQKTLNDSIDVGFFITNKKNSDRTIIHPTGFANVAVYKKSEFIFPDVDPYKMVYLDEYNESVIPAQARIQVWTRRIHLSEPEGAKAVGFALFHLKPGNTKGLSASAVVNSHEYWWLVTPPITIE